MTRLMASAPAPIGLSASDTGLTVWARAARTLHRWSRRRRSRIALAHLNDHLLHDIGLDPTAARSEASRPFWR